jgi:hypothetical protein
MLDTLVGQVLTVIGTGGFLAWLCADAADKAGVFSFFQ